MSANTIDQLGGMIHTQAIIDFYNGAQHNDVKSQKAGRPVYDDVEMIRIRWAGNTKSELHAPASDRCDRPIRNKEDNSRYYVAWKDHPDFKAAYEAFKSGQASALNGTPISELPFLSEARRLELKAINILTAEALAGVDVNSRLGAGLSDIRRQAQLYLERAAGAAVDAKHEAEKAAMQAQLDEMRARLDALAGGAAPAAKAKPKRADVPRAEKSASPFDSWEDADIRAWMKDADPDAEDPGPVGHNQLVALADALNARIREKAA